MPLLGPIEIAVDRTARRLRWLRGWNGLWKGALTGACLYLLALLTFKLLPVPRESMTVGGWGALASTVLGFVIGFWRKTPLLEGWVAPIRSCQPA